MLLAPVAAAVSAWALTTLGLPFAIEFTFGAVLVGSIALTLLRRDCLMWSTFAVGLIAHSVLWDRAASLGAVVRYDYVADIDRVIGFGALPTVRLQEELFRSGSLGAFDGAMLVIYFSFYALPLFLLTPLRKRDYEHGRSYIATMLLTSLASWPVFALVPTAPPWLAAENGVEAAAMVLPLKSMLQGITASTYLAAGTNLYAAMPSLHQGIAVICALAAMNAWPRIRWAAAAYVVAMAVSLVYLGEHYVIDVLIGSALGAGIWRGVQLIDPWARRTRWRAIADDSPLPAATEPDVR